MRSFTQGLSIRFITHTQSQICGNRVCRISKGVQEPAAVSVVFAPTVAAQQLLHWKGCAENMSSLTYRKMGDFLAQLWAGQA